MLALAGVLLPLAAEAQAAGDAGLPAAPVTTLPTMEVVGTSPLLGSGIERDKVPSNVRSLSDRDLLRPPDLGASLDQRNASVTINGVQDSPYQPDIQFRGFDVSPLIGTPQGLAVYQNGVRLNEAFSGARYETFGAIFSPSTIPSLGLAIPRSLRPAPPRAAWVGVRASF